MTEFPRNTHVHGAYINNKTQQEYTVIGFAQLDQDYEEATKLSVTMTDRVVVATKTGGSRQDSWLLTDAAPAGSIMVLYQRAHDSAKFAREVELFHAKFKFIVKEEESNAA